MWTQVKMMEISAEVMTYRLHVNPSFKPVRQKTRSTAPHHAKVVDEEVDKLLGVGSIWEVQFP